MNRDFKKAPAPRPDPGDKPHAGLGDRQTVTPQDGGRPAIEGSNLYHENDGRVVALFPQATDGSGNPAVNPGGNPAAWGQSVNGYLKIRVAGRRIVWVRDDAAAGGFVTFYRLRWNSRDQTEWMRVTQAVVAFETQGALGAPAVVGANLFTPKVPVIEIDFDEVEIFTTGASIVQALIAIGDARITL